MAILGNSLDLAAAAVPTLFDAFHYRPWAAAPAVPRSPTPGYLGAPRHLPAVWYDVHDPAGLVGSGSAVHFALPATGL